MAGVHRRALWHPRSALERSAHAGLQVHPPQPTTDTTAKLMLVALSFCWGLTWPAMRVALAEIPPFSMRSVSLGLGAVSLLTVVAVQKRGFALGGPRDWLHVAVASVLNIVGFTMLSSFALL